MFLLKLIVLHDIISIHCSANFSICMDSSKKLWVFGKNNAGQLGVADPSWFYKPKLIKIDNVLAVACGSFHTLIQTEERKVYAFGRNFYGQLGLGDQADRTSPTLWGNVNAQEIWDITIKARAKSARK